MILFEQIIILGYPGRLTTGKMTYLECPLESAMSANCYGNLEAIW